MLFQTEKDKFESLINEYNSIPSLISLTISDLYTLPNSIINDNINFQKIYGVKNSKILTSAVIHGLNSYCPAINNIVYQNLFIAHLDTTPPNVLTKGGAFYFQTYLSDDTIFIYELDNFARVINSHVIPLNNIISISDIKNHIVLHAKTSHSKTASNFYFVKINNDDYAIFEILSKKGISISKINESVL
ncbi:MAG: hypothetical protein ACRCTZ_16680 [Sarcina sp.]